MYVFCHHLAHVLYILYIYYICMYVVYIFKAYMFLYILPQYIDLTLIYVFWPRIVSAVKPAVMYYLKAHADVAYMYL